MELFNTHLSILFKYKLFQAWNFKW